MSADTSPELQRFALQTIIRYLKVFVGVTDTQIVSEASKDSPNFTSDQLKNFLTRPARATTYGRHIASLGPAVVRILDKRLPTAPDAIAAMVGVLRGATEQISDSSQADLYPATDVRNWSNMPGSNDALSEAIQGFWWVARISTTDFDNADITEYNVALLNLFPVDQINAELQRMKFYQKGKFDEHPDSFGGHVIAESERVNLLAASPNPSSRKISLISATVKIGENREHLLEMRGQMRGYTSEGRAHASHFFAEFVEGTDKLSGQQFDAEKELLKSNCGVYTIDQLKKRKLIKNFDALRLMTDWSRTDLVFRSRN